MSHLTLALSFQAAEAHWGEDAILSFSNDCATIHLDKPVQDKENLVKIQMAARSLDGMNLAGVSLAGEWTSEQQWAFALSFTRARKPIPFSWLENDDKDELQKRFNALVFTRDLVNSSPEDLAPEDLVNRAVDWLGNLSSHPISIRKWVGEQLLEDGWIGIYNVGRGSVRPPVLLELDYNPTGNADAPVWAALVGKGITFDSGGYSIKSSEGMLHMKCDMGGAATVTGGLGLAIMQGLNKRVKLFLCCAENLISGHAYKLGDILTYKNGVTVEIVNTDAEGRLVLADGLIAAGETGALLTIDAATLTGAAVAATGGDYHAVFGLDQGVLDSVKQCAIEENEPVWQLPLEKWHQTKCPSNFADTANSRAQKGGGAGGASNAAGFLSRFVADDGKGWVHMDLAAAYNNSATNLLPAGATGMGIRTIAKALLNN